MARGGSAGIRGATKPTEPFRYRGYISSSISDQVRFGGSPHTDKFSMYPGGMGRRGGGRDTPFKVNILEHTSNAYIGTGSFDKFRFDTSKIGSGSSINQSYANVDMSKMLQGRHSGSRYTMTRRGPGKVLVGTLQGNIPYRQNVKLGADGQPFRVGGVGTAIKYRVQPRPGRFGFNSMITGRYRNPYKSNNWQFQLSQSLGPNKAPHGVAQSSLDTTKERYSTAETRFQKEGMYNRSEQWNDTTRKFERQWRGWKDLKINKTWKHYTLDMAPMFKDHNLDQGAARRVTRKAL